MGRLANQPVASAAHWFLSRSALSKAFYVPTSLLNVPLTHAFELSSRIGQLALVLPEGIGLSIHTLRRDVHFIIGALGGSDEDVAGGADPLLAKDEGKRLDCAQSSVSDRAMVRMVQSAIPHILAELISFPSSAQRAAAQETRGRPDAP